MSSRLPRDEALEKENRIDEMKKIKNSPPVPHLLQAQQAPALPYAKVVGRPGTGSYPAPSPDPTTHALSNKNSHAQRQAKENRLQSQFHTSIFSNPSLIMNLTMLCCQSKIVRFKGKGEQVKVPVSYIYFQ